MRLLVLSDIHGNTSRVRDILEEAGEFDLIALVGDLTDFGPSERAVEIMNLFKDYSDVVIGVPGNCDPEGVPEAIDEYGVLIDGEVARIGDIEFVGLGGSNPTPFDTPREKSEEEISKELNRVFDKTSEESVLVSHAPPKGYLDLANGNHAGSQSVLEAIKEHGPRLVLSGHIHEARGKEKINNTLLVNPGAARDGKYAIIEINDELTVEFLKK